MKRVSIFVISVIILGIAQGAYAQDELDMELEVSDEEKTLLFAGFAIVVIAIYPK